MEIRVNKRPAKAAINTLRPVTVFPPMKNIPPSGPDSPRDKLLAPEEVSAHIGDLRERLSLDAPLLFAARDCAAPGALDAREEEIDVLIEQHPESLTQGEQETLFAFLQSEAFPSYLARILGGPALPDMEFEQSVETFANKSARLLHNLQIYCADRIIAQDIAAAIESSGDLLAERLAGAIGHVLPGLDRAAFTDSLQSIILQRQFSYQLDYAGGRITNRDRFCDVQALLADRQYGDIAAREQITATNGQFGWITYGDVAEFVSALRQLEEALTTGRALLYALRERSHVQSPEMRRLRHMHLLGAQGAGQADAPFVQGLGALYGDALQNAALLRAGNPYREMLYALAYGRVAACLAEDQAITTAEFAEMGLRPALAKRALLGFDAALREAIRSRYPRYGEEQAAQ